MGAKIKRSAGHHVRLSDREWTSRAPVVPAWALLLLLAAGYWRCDGVELLRCARLRSCRLRGGACVCVHGMGVYLFLGVRVGGRGIARGSGRGVAWRAHQTVGYDMMRGLAWYLLRLGR